MSAVKRRIIVKWGLILEAMVSLLLVMTQNVIVIIILLLCDAIADSMEIPAKRAIVGPLLGGLLYDKGGYWVSFCILKVWTREYLLIESMMYLK
ncbi:MAG: hypothetical protein AB9856_05410 [Cellulosilyticaceae bacterium]